MHSQKYGHTVLTLFFKEKLRNKYRSWVEHKQFPLLFGVAIFMPIAPDDFLCYLAGTTKMSFKKFTAIILIGKPLPPIAIYSFGLELLFRYISSFVT
ncbi:VTT domain-containing protein [Gracilibacillus sp. JCM 18860]|uniref:VTT domain-containing protein n=1 Tax=Gracilibacillus sp. JCM 18860 TaxID=1306159 RepID=UPI00325FFC40